MLYSFVFHCDFSNPNRITKLKQIAQPKVVRFLVHILLLHTKEKTWQNIFSSFPGLSFPLLKVMSRNTFSR